ncbi:MAG: hypothetical protein ABFD16_10330 [Thermoguttaceae bacterium]|jgi:hypothetical protein
MEPIAHLRRAKEAVQAEGAARGRLLTAGQEFWEALFDLGTWPPELQEVADQITGALLSHGTIQTTVDSMDEATVQKTLRRLTDFCDKAESILRG